jgi:hydrogenase-4 component B
MAFLIGSLAIVGLPPLNGFVSEWLIFRGLIEAGSVAGTFHAAAAATAGLGLTGALALACFTKLHGTVFLGNPRQELPEARPGLEKGLVAPQIMLAAACVAIGMLPAVVVPVAARAAAAVLGGAGVETRAAAAAASAGAISWMALAVVGLTVAIWMVRGSRATVATREAATWACAYPAVTSRMQYTASSYAASLLGMFGPWSGSRVVAGEQALHVEVADPVLDRVGLPLWARVQRAASSLRVIQTGRLRWYLLYLIFTLLALLVYLWVAT